MELVEIDFYKISSAIIMNSFKWKNCSTIVTFPFHFPNDKANCVSNRKIVIYIRLIKDNDNNPTNKVFRAESISVTDRRRPKLRKNRVTEDLRKISTPM